MAMLDKKTQNLLEKLNQLNIKLWVDDKQLRINAPKGALNQELRIALQESKETLITHFFDMMSAKNNNIEWPKIKQDKKHRYDSFPLTEIQHAYWMGRNGGIELGNVATHYYFELDCANLDLKQFNKAFCKLIERHDMLRGIVDQDGQQRILKQVPAYFIQVQDLRNSKPEQKESQLVATRAEMASQILPADQWPLFDIRAIQLSDSLSRVYFSWDFINQDAWSLYILFDEWHALYQDLTTILPDIEISYRDYVLAERTLRKSEAYRNSHEYWWKRIDTLPAAPILPVNRKSTSYQQHHFTRRHYRLRLNDWESLKTQSRAMGVTATTLLLAAFSEVLALWSESPHFSLNLTLYNRLPLHEHIDRLTGDFTSLSLLEIDNREGTTFMDRVTRIQEQFLKDLEHRYISGVEVIREWSKRNGCAMHAVMPVVFTSNLVHGSSNSNDSGVVEKFGQKVYGISQTPQVWLDHQIMEDKDGLVFNWDAVEEIFAPGVLDDMFTAYCQLLERLAASPDSWQSNEVVSLPNEQKLQRQVVNNTTMELGTTTLYELFVNQAHHNKDAIAVECDGLQISYGQLLVASRQLGQQLFQKGVKRNQLIAVVMEKGWQQIVAVLGIMNSGAAYVPIATDLPAARRAQLFEQSGALLAMTQPFVKEKLTWPENVECIVIDETSLDINEDVVSNHATVNKSEDLAYVIFTSGSTGIPKGVMINHMGAVNTVLSINRLFGVNQQDRVLAVSSLSFDLSVYDIFGTLAAGGTIVLPDAGRAHDSDHYHQLLAERAITIWNSTPPLMNLLIDYLEDIQQAGTNTLRLVLLSGDWVPVNLTDRIRTLFSNTDVISLGGATEASIWSIYYPIIEVDKDWQSIPYGKPLPNQTMYVLNSRLQACPVGVIGDIYIGGSGLALGYLKDEEKTARHFICHPTSGERLYFTGDKGRYCQGNNIEFIGREDSQVKLHGHRIELGEISATIQSLPGVEHAVVQKIENGGKQSLQAYLVLNKDKNNPLYEKVIKNKDECNKTWRKLVEAGEQQVTQFPFRHADQLEVFKKFWKKVEQIAVKSMLETLQKVITTPLSFSQLNETLLENGICDQHLPLVRQWLKVLEDKKMITVKDQVITTMQEVTQLDNVDRDLEALRKYAIWNNNAHSLYEYIVRCFTNQTQLLKGQVEPLDLLFVGGDWTVAEALYQNNPVSQYHNTVMTDILKSVANNKNDSQGLNILEIGAGTGSTTASLLPVLDMEKSKYCYTDLTSFFFLQAKKKFKDFPFVQYKTYDLDQGIIEQGFQPHSFDILVASNVLHDAKNIPHTIENLRNLLVPGGFLFLLEGTQNTPLQMVTVAYLEGFGHFQDLRLKDNLPLLSTGQWKSVIQQAGYEKFAHFPLDENSTDVYVQHVLIAQSPYELRSFKAEHLQRYIKDRLPEYMIPRDFIEIDTLPLTANGKIDMKALPVSDLLMESKDDFVAPESEYEKKLADIWCELLSLDSVGIHNNFFDIGGDSLLIMQLRNKIQATFGVHVTTTTLFEYTTISELVSYLNGSANQVPDLEEAHDRAAKQRDALAKRRKLHMEKRHYA